MSSHLLKCPLCKKYTLHKQCSCGGIAVSPKPPKFSPEDPYGRYRRIAKQEEWKEKGYL